MPVTAVALRYGVARFAQECGTASVAGSVAAAMVNGLIAAQKRFRV